jgi:hypothetical protein
MAALDFHDANAFDSSVIIHFMGGLWVGARLLKAKDIGKKSDFFPAIFFGQKKTKTNYEKKFRPEKTRALIYASMLRVGFPVLFIFRFLRSKERLRVRRTEQRK